MGFGDVRLAFILGLFLGWLDPYPYGHVFLGLFLGFALGSVVGLALMALRLRTRKDHIPFGPFLAGGTVLAIFVGSPAPHRLLRAAETRAATQVCCLC